MDHFFDYLALAAAVLFLVGAIRIDLGRVERPGRNLKVGAIAVLVCAVAMMAGAFLREHPLEPAALVWGLAGLLMAASAGVLFWKLRGSRTDDGEKAGQ